VSHARMKMGSWLVVCLLSLLVLHRVNMSYTCLTAAVYVSTKHCTCNQF
jgi:hypothetical protein